MLLSARQRRAVQVSRALADRTRFCLLLQIAAHGEASCLELVRRMRLAQATISHHLKVLSAAGLVSVRPSGPYHFHRVRGRALKAHGATLTAAFARPADRPPSHRRTPPRKEPST
jgi:ArsR family transcriptional regulator, arsenate/arsenite/antimonite-responsive transcriptional repressor